MIKKMIAPVVVSLGLTLAASPAGAAPNNARQGGLVNLALQDTVVQVPIGIAANICGVQANILAAGNVAGPVTCNATGNADANA